MEEIKNQFQKRKRHNKLNPKKTKVKKGKRKKSNPKKIKKAYRNQKKSFFK
jgi:hypothetical protein